VTATGDPADSPAQRADEAAVEPPVFDRHLVIEQLGGWRGMLDATLPTLAFIVANSLGGLRTGIWAALATALVVFLLRLVRRETLQQAVSGLIGVAIAVAIARASGEARDFFVIGILRSAVIAVVLFLSVAVRRPLVGVAAEFLAPSHLGALATGSLPGFGRRPADRAAAARPARGAAEPVPERHWREDPRLLRAYGWLTVLWGATFALRAVVQYVLYRADDVALLGTMSIVLGLPVTAVALAITLWVVSRLHRHRQAAPIVDPGTPSA
jgi:hypothetical protein